MKITGTFLDEISHDIPHQNWGKDEWDQDFKYMRSIGIDTVILIRCGHKKWQTFPSKVLSEKAGCYAPDTDLVRLFLELAEKNNMSFYFGLYDSGDFFESGTYEREVEINKFLIDEVWEEYGASPAFQGWYISQETSRRSDSIIEIYRQLGSQCKEVSSNLTTLISPFIDGRKAVLSSNSSIGKSHSISPEKHHEEWDQILAGIQSSIDVVAFQDGQIDFDQLSDFLAVNKELTDKHSMKSWSNTESFDRDMPIKFLPIKWDKLRLKMEAASGAGVEKLITFEFSHFMSPQSAYSQAGHLFNRYREYLQANP